VFFLDEPIKQKETRTNQSQNGAVFQGQAENYDGAAVSHVRCVPYPIAGLSGLRGLRGLPSVGRRGGRSGPGVGCA
jgi:hypothetical protein